MSSLRAFLSLLLLGGVLRIVRTASAHTIAQQLLTAPAPDDEHIRKLQPTTTTINNDDDSISSPSSPATYYFGHSLIYYALPILESSGGNANLNVFAVPYWMNQLWIGIQKINTNNNTTTTTVTPWLADGQFRTDNYQLPPIPNWGFQPDISKWQDTAENLFATLYDYDSVVYTEINFVQYREPWRTYETTGDTTTSTASTPVDSVLRILDYVQTEQEDGGSTTTTSGPVLYIYEGWMDAGGRVPEDISQTTTTQQNAYYAENAWDSNYHHWWIQLMDRVRLERPHARFQMVPVAPILMGILSSYFPAASFFDLFEDSAPHGRPIVYFWASVILYLHMAPPTNNNNNNHTDLLVAVVERLATESDMLLPNVPISTVVESIASQVAVPTDITSTTSSPSRMSPTTTSPSQPPLTMLSPASPVTPPPTRMPFSVPSQQAQPQPFVDNSCCDQSIPEEGADDNNGVTTTTCSTVEYCNESMENCQGDCEGRWVPFNERIITPGPSTTPAPVTTIPSLPPMTDTTTVAQNCCEKEGSCSTIDYCNEAQVHCLDDCEGTWVVLTLNGEEEESTTLEGTNNTSTTVSSAPSSNAKTSSASSRLTGIQATVVQITWMWWRLLVVVVG